MTKRPDLRVPPEERVYGTIDKPRIVTGKKFGLLPAKEPCKECPLARTAPPGLLGGYTIDQYLQVLHGDADLACHMSKGFPHYLETQRSCTGVAMYRCNVGHIPGGQNAREAMREAGGNRELAFASPDEFRIHHATRRK